MINDEYYNALLDYNSIWLVDLQDDGDNDSDIDSTDFVKYIYTLSK